MLANLFSSLVEEAFKKDLHHRRSLNFLARLVARFFPRYIPFAAG